MPTPPMASCCRFNVVHRLSDLAARSWATQPVSPVLTDDTSGDMPPTYRCVSDTSSCVSLPGDRP